MAGTQAPKTHINNLIVMKLSNLKKTGQNDKSDNEDEDEELSDDEDEVDGPKMDGALIKHQGCVNRVRVGLFG